MDFGTSDRARDYLERLDGFVESLVEPAESVYLTQRNDLTRSGAPHGVPPIVEELKSQARAAGLWNLFLPQATEPAHGLSVLDYAPLAERTGWFPDFLPEVLNCSAPDTGNMELLDLFGSDRQRARWLKPLLNGEIRSAFAMTEPNVASSDATNIATRIARDGDDFVIDGRKWWVTGALDPRCRVLVVMGVTDPDAPASRRQSVILVPADTPGVEVARDLSVYGYHERQGHAEVVFSGARVPAENLLGEQGAGFAMAQARLGPGRIHHCMRAIGMAERALSLMRRRAADRVAFHRPLAERGVIRQWFAESRIAVEQARLLVHKAAWLVDRHGVREARLEIAAIKVAVPRTVCGILDTAVQLFGGAGVGPDTPLPNLWTAARTMRIADGPDEVHLRSIAKAELARSDS